MTDDRNRTTRRALLGGAAAAAALAVPSTAYGASSRRPVDQAAIDEAAARLDVELIALRRDLHAHPESPGAEERTAGIVAELLTAAGLTVTTGVGGHGVVGVLKGRFPGRTIAYRADMDAVPEAGPGGSGPAHICGHDLHTTVGVGAARVLAGLRHRLAGTVVFVFQPAEESLQGAQAMIDDGVLDRTRPAEIHALHCGPFPVGTLAVTPGTGLPGLDHVTVTLTGAGAMENALRLAGDISALTTVPDPSTPEALEQLIEDLLTPNGPLARFVTAWAYPDEAGPDGDVDVQVWSRCWPEERYVEVREAIGGLAAVYEGARVEFPGEPFPAMVCPVEDGLVLRRHLRRELGRDAVLTMGAAGPFNGEDFALFLDRLPGTFTYLGVRRPGAEISTATPHFPDFDPDERAIGVGVRAMAGWLATRARKG